MKIKIENIGPIKNIEFDFSKNLHLIFGKNNIGKSFSVNLIYCLVKSFIENNRFNTESDTPYRGLSIYKEFNEDKVVKSYSEQIINNSKELPSENIVKYIISKSFLKDFQAMFSTIVSLQKNIKNQYSDKNGLITIDLEQIQFSIEIDQNGHFSIKNLKLKTVYSVKTEDNSIEVYRNNEWIFTCMPNIIAISLAEDIISRIIVQINVFIDKIYFLPASRSGLYPAINSFSPIIAELTKNRYFISNRKIELPTLSEITSSYYIALSTLNDNISDKKMNEIAKTMEKRLLKGKIKYDIKEGKLYYNPENTKLQLEISETSSMVAEISPIVTYLRYILTNKFSDEELEIRKKSEVDDIVKSEKTNLIIIEEPEAHLHPEAQLILMEIFGELSKLNVKLIITSHSNYMFNKLGNLILENKIDYKMVESHHLIMTKEGSVCNMDMVVSREGIEDYNFIDISEKLYEERMNLLEKLEDDVIK